MNTHHTPQPLSDTQTQTIALRYDATRSGKPTRMITAA